MEKLSVYKKKHFSYFIHDDICKQITNAIISDVRRKKKSVYQQRYIVPPYLPTTIHYTPVSYFYIIRDIRRILRGIL